MSISEAVLLDALQGVSDPLTGDDYVGARQIRNLRLGPGAEVGFEVHMGYPARSLWPDIEAALVAAATRIPGVRKVDVAFSTRVIAHAVRRGVELLPEVRNIIAVASGKGGVGKSTTAVNLALALAAEGASVGILDADIYGPSQPMMLGVAGRPEIVDGKMEPHRSHGIQVISIGFLVDADQAVIWRGPMVTQALDQLLRQTNWQDLDYLIVDLPPGTGDIQLSLSQKVPLTGAVIVTTPQDIALLDARRGIKMFEKVGVPILGVVENMALHTCSGCGRTEHIFGEGGGARLALQHGVDHLGSLPLSLAIREQSDSGVPTVVADPDGEIASVYKDIARRVAARVATLAKDYSSKFPTITVSAAS